MLVDFLCGFVLGLFCFVTRFDSLVFAFDVGFLYLEVFDLFVGCFALLCYCLLFWLFLVLVIGVFGGMFCFGFVYLVWFGF